MGVWRNVGSGEVVGWVGGWGGWRGMDGMSLGHVDEKERREG